MNYTPMQQLEWLSEIVWSLQRKTGQSQIMTYYTVSLMYHSWDDKIREMEKNSGQQGQELWTCL